ncbi:CIR protein [Plasmodium chabaudi chabaudi]|uniref:CIR protein n=1 Tax=Plasmodium chabaudi chabaudi TaxID=31271 RepID=A0A4V6M9L9_PLACU|nr:CIR protein [Plasmodium chabaudi chabaudi]VTZ69966.1 CIR protein [Plasmodium chabaudi chabaudi]|eukprot:XP_016654398.1 CIR protein [Plasmodium chabaudi chabaudi]
MSKHKQLCMLLLEGDSYFNDENVDTEKINKDITIKGYCRNGSCKTNEESIDALAAYIFKKFKDSIKVKQRYNNYDECLLMWISDKLFKMHLKSIDKKDVNNYMDGTTLNEAYKNYLEKYKGIFDYWAFLDMIKGLKEANLKYMSEYYKLLNLICKIITGYYNGTQTKQFYKYPADCSHQYKNLYLNIYKCKPYLDLLNKLKGIYDDFSSFIKKNSSNSKLAAKLQTLTPKDGKEMKAVRGFKTYDISNTKCKFPQKKITNPKKADKSPLQSSSKEEPPPQPQKKDSPSPPPPSGQLKNSQHETPPSPQGSNVLPKTKEGGSNPQNGQGASKIESMDSESSKSNTGGASGDVSNPNSENRGPGGVINDKIDSEGKSNDGTSKRTNDAGTSPPGPQASSQAAGSENQGNMDGDTQSVQKNGTNTPKGIDAGPGNTKDNENIEESGKKDSNDVAGKQNTHPESGSPSSGTGNGDSNEGGAGLGAGGQDSETGGGQGSQVRDSGSGTSGGSGSDTDNQEGGTGGDKENQEGPDGSGNDGGGTDSTPGEKEPQNTPWPSFDIKPYIYMIASKGMEQINNASKLFNEHKEKITDAIDNINSLYNTSVSNLKTTFINFTEFFNNFINNLSIDSKQVEDPPDSGDKQSGSGGTGDDPPTPNAPSEGPKDSDDNKPGSDGTEGDPPTRDDPSKPQKDPPQQDLPQQDLPQQDLSQQNPHQPSSDASQTLKAPQTSPTPPTMQTTQNSKEQGQEHKPPQDPSGNHNSDQTDKEGSQKLMPASVTKQENPGTELKGNEITKIGGSYVLKEYKQFVILTIVFLIPIALAIMYQYLSFGRRKKLKGKKNMKKVINLFGANKTTKTVINSSDGKKQIQIIIKSSGQKKQTIKSINSVYGEKSPSLNIYQLMQADPVPFINLFFLLIFFVYKRKENTIE